MTRAKILITINTRFKEGLLLKLHGNSLLQRRHSKNTYDHALRKVDMLNLFQSKLQYMISMILRRHKLE